MRIVGWALVNDPHIVWQVFDMYMANLYHLPMVRKRSLQVSIEIPRNRSCVSKKRMVCNF